MVALDQSTNVLPVNQVTSSLEPNVKPLVKLTTSEMVTTDAENAQIHARPAHQPLPVPHVSNHETNPSTESVTHAFIHAPPVPLTNNVPDVWLVSVSSMVDAQVNAPLVHHQSMESVNAQMVFSKMVNALPHAQMDGLTSMEHANNVLRVVVNVQERLQLVLNASLDFC